MTDAVTTADDLVADVLAVLSAHRWMTAREIWQRCRDSGSHQAVRHALRGLVELGKVEDRIGGRPEHPVREYRAWK